MALAGRASHRGFLGPVILLLAFLLSCLPFEAVSTALPARPVDITQQTDITLPPEKPFSPLSPRCVGIAEWAGGGMVGQHCMHAIRDFWDEIKDIQDESYLFLARGGAPHGRLEVMQTPLKWTYETCTLVIVMMTEDIDMPGRPARRYYAADEGTFGEIWTAALGLYYSCVRGRGKPAWTARGPAYDESWTIKKPVRAIASDITSGAFLKRIAKSWRYEVIASGDFLRGFQDIPPELHSKTYHLLEGVLPIMPSRYIPSDLDQLRQPKDPKAQLVQSLEKIVREYPPRDSYNPRECHGLYSGPTSIAYLFLQIWRNHPKLIIAKTTPDYWAVQYLRGERTFSPITPAKNGIGSETLAFHVVRGAVNQKDPLDEQKFLNWMRPLADTDEEGSDEWLYGRAGCLYLLRVIHEWKPRAVGFVNVMMPKILNAILDHGPSWPWHGKDYLGAVHGRIGIITQVILCDPFKASHPVILTSLKEVLDLQDEEGNWPSSMHSSHHSLVQFCHGAPGFVICLKAIEPHLSFDRSLQKQVVAAYEKAEMCVAQKGILTKQPNLCHGTSGNALALPSPLREHFMTYTTGEAVRSGLEQGVLIPGDDPYGLFCGEAGRAWAWSALVSETQMGMIGFSDL